MGEALSQGGYRDKVFLMTKIDGRGKDEATRQIETSLERLKTDRIDLLQHHEILRFDDPDRIFAKGGAMEAFVAAQQAGKFAMLVSPATRIPGFTCICWRPRQDMDSGSIPCKCR
jgi:aryl-alcohol dehydrogenase-like predicted oxidoreductase